MKTKTTSAKNLIISFLVTVSTFILTLVAFHRYNALEEGIQLLKDKMFSEGVATKAESDLYYALIASAEQQSLAVLALAIITIGAGVVFLYYLLKFFYNRVIK